MIANATELFTHGRSLQTELCSYLLAKCSILECVSACGSLGEEPGLGRSGAQRNKYCSHGADHVRLLADKLKEPPFPWSESSLSPPIALGLLCPLTHFSNTVVYISESGNDLTVLNPIDFPNQVHTRPVRLSVI